MSAKIAMNADLTFRMRIADLPDDVIAELTERMFRSRASVRWLVLSTLPITIYAISGDHGLHAVVLAIIVWLAGALRIVVAELYAWRGSRSQSRLIQMRWQVAYATGGISLALAFSVLTAHTILDGDSWLAGWALATSIALSYGAVRYVAMRPMLGCVQVALPIIVPAIALIASGERVQHWMGLSLLIALVSVVQNVRAQFTATVNAMLDRRHIGKLASTDPLTGLWNRRQLEAVMQEALGEALPGLNWLGIDLDRFKPVNDTLGHAAGDAVLRAVADRITRIAGPDAFVARVGGDEFVVLLIGDRPHAQAIAERIVRTLAEPIVVAQGVARIGASVGTTAICSHDTIDEIAKRADERMYRKKAGKLAA